MLEVEEICCVKLGQPGRGLEMLEVERAHTRIDKVDIAADPRSLSCKVLVFQALA
jgi:hypothetical protein